MESFPPGTQQIKDDCGKDLVLSPQPTNDTNQPLNWSGWQKTLHMILLCLYTMMVFAILCVSTPLWVPINEELGISYEALNQGYATNAATLAVGCVLLIPCALRFGRRPIYVITCALLLAAAIWQAKMTTTGEMIAANALSGFAGSASEALFQVTISDTFFVHQRGTMNGFYWAAVLVGNYFAPVAGGYVTNSQGWRWAYWWCSIIMAVIFVLLVFFLEESKYQAPALTGGHVSIPGQYQVNGNDTKTSTTVETDAKSITATPSNTSREQEEPKIPLRTYRERHSFYTLTRSKGVGAPTFLQQMIRPFKILVTFPAAAFAAIQYGWVIAMLGILAVTQATLYPAPPYNFSAIGVGNMKIPPAIGAILGSAFGGPLTDWISLKIARRRQGIHEPEVRLYLFLVPGLAMTVGSFLYGITISQGDPWILTAIGGAFIGFSVGGVGDMSLTYLQDSYSEIVGVSLVGVVFVRNIVTTALVFSLTPWINGMGVKWMFVLLGCIGAGFAFLSIPFILWGKKWRIKSTERFECYRVR